MMFKYKTPSFKCMNCDKEISWSRKIKTFCSEYCKQEADYIRYYRRCIKDGRVNRPDVKEVLKIRVAHLVSGGYNKFERTISKQLREKIIKRDKGICQICKKPGNEIDHIEGNSSNLSNLQLLCYNCHIKKTMSKIVIIKPDDEKYEEVLRKKKVLDLRVLSKNPIKICDDEENWKLNSKAIIKKRKAVFYNSLLKYVEKLINENVSYRKISKYLNDNNIPTFSGYGKWGYQGIKCIIEIINK